MSAGCTVSIFVGDIVYTKLFTIWTWDDVVTGDSLRIWWHNLGSLLLMDAVFSVKFVWVVTTWWLWTNIAQSCPVSFAAEGLVTCGWGELVCWLDQWLDSWLNKWLVSHNDWSSDTNNWSGTVTSIITAVCSTVMFWTVASIILSWCNSSEQSDQLNSEIESKLLLKKWLHCCNTLNEYFTNLIFFFETQNCNYCRKLENLKSILFKIWKNWLKNVCSYQESFHFEMFWVN